MPLPPVGRPNTGGQSANFARSRSLFLCKFAEGAPDGDNLRLIDEALPCIIGLNVEDERRKLDCVDQPVLLCQSIQKAPLNSAVASCHVSVPIRKQSADHNT
jgi:hypothetical protein